MQIMDIPSATVIRVVALAEVDRAAVLAAGVRLALMAIV
jgi:hypothetical protein